MVQMQMASQQGMAPTANNPIAHIQRLGLRNMYRGASATLLRDVPFAMMYFASYSRIKYAMQGDRDRLSFFETLLAATAAALPASFFTTPADVLKTRLQVYVAAAGACGVWSRSSFSRCPLSSPLSSLRGSRDRSFSFSNSISVSFSNLSQ